MKQFRNMVYPYVAWIAVMIVAPMLMIVLYAFTNSGNDVTTIRFTLENFALLLQRSGLSGGVVALPFHRSDDHHHLRAGGVPHCLCHCPAPGKEQYVLGTGHHHAPPGSI